MRWHVTATHSSDALGFPATNRQVAFRGMTMLEFKDGRVVEGVGQLESGRTAAIVGRLTVELVRGA